MKKLPYVLLILIILGIISWFVFLLTSVNLQLFNPAGIIAQQQKMLIFASFSVMFLVAIPIILSVYFMVWKYKSTNKKSKHDPDWVGNRTIKTAFWAFFSSLLIVFFGVIWVSSHMLDPKRPIDSNIKPKTIQVVALDWKWLFIYPEEGIATVNFIQIPINTPINFRLTADAPMNSFWIPSLGGQIYAMSGMETQINLMGNKIGDYPGEAAEINGVGFSGMRFIARVSSNKDFDNWVKKVKLSNNNLNQISYEKLSKPSENVPVKFYSSIDPLLFNKILMQNKNLNSEKEAKNFNRLEYMEADNHENMEETH